MVRSRVLLSAIFATLGVALAGCAAPLSRGNHTPAGHPYGKPTATIAASGVYGRGYRPSMLVHLTGVSPARGSVGWGLCGGDAPPPEPTGYAGCPRSPPPRPSRRGWSSLRAEGERPADIQTAE